MDTLKSSEKQNESGKISKPRTHFRFFFLLNWIWNFNFFFFSYWKLQFVCFSFMWIFKEEEKLFERKYKRASHYYFAKYKNTKNHSWIGYARGVDGRERVEMDSLRELTHAGRVSGAVLVGDVTCQFPSTLFIAPKSSSPLSLPLASFSLHESFPLALFQLLIY